MENKINHIIVHVLSGEASSEDILALCKWLGEDEKHQDEFCQLKSYWDAEVAFNHTLVPSLSADKLQQTILQQVQSTKKIRIGHTFIFMAASIALLIALTVVGILQYTEHTATEYYTYLTDEHKSSFTMDDGTVVTLNKNSRLCFSDAFGKKERIVNLEGEAYFDVVKDVSKPFHVKMGNATITVLGTQFNVKAEPKTNNIMATLVEGSIRFDREKQHIVLTPNQQLIYNRSTDEVDIKRVDTDIFISWKDGLLKYKSIPFVDLISDLKKIYKVDIKLENKKLSEPDVTVSGTFSRDQNIEEILKVISRSLSIRWHNGDGVYYIR